MPRPVHRATRGIALAGSLALAAHACTFSEASEDFRANSCKVDSDCTRGSTCEDGICVGENSDGLAVSLEVTPMRLPDGSQPLPLTFGPFSLSGPRTRDFELLVPVLTTGKVRDGSKPIAAELHFTPVYEPGLPPPTTQIAATFAPTIDPDNPDAEASDDPDFAVALLRGVAYRVLVEPTDTALPPRTVDFTADAGAVLSIDYATVRWTVQRFFVQDLPADRNVVIRALDALTGEPISSSAKLTDAPATLIFPPAPVPEFRIEITAEQSYATASKLGSPCDLTTPVFPVLRVGQAALQDDETGTHIFVMPEVPAPIRYSGAVALCPGHEIEGLAAMPMSFDARTLLFGGDANVEASYGATTTAALDEASGELRFCTRVLPGDYVVVVTPPTNSECEVFAEKRLINSLDGSEVADVLLSLRQSAVLRGTVETPDGLPVNGAQLEAHALGRDILLSDGDASVSSYNRSTQTSSDNSGDFRLPLDLGSYDLVVKPAPGSNFAWQVLHDIAIDSRDGSLVARITLDAPVAIDGGLNYRDASKHAQRSLGGAQVRAYARIPGAGETARTLEVARTVANEDGEVTLLVAPEMHAGF